MNTLERNTIVGGRYLIVNLQHKDVDGEVYLAVDQTSGKSVLMKRMFCYDERQSHSLQKEALALMKLKHPSLPRFIDYFSEGSTRYLVSESISGEYVSKVVETSGKPVPLDWTIFWADKLLETLDYLHSQSPPIIHRDVKPQNLKYSEYGDIFLLGFPLSITGQNTKSSYASLEQIRGVGVTERCDIYSFSATLYYLLTAQAPPDVKTRADQVFNQLPDPIKPVYLVNPKVPKEISDFVMRGMNLSPSLRYSSVKEMQKLLREINASLKKEKSREHLGAPVLQSEVKTEVLNRENVAVEAAEEAFETVFTASELDSQKRSMPEARQSIEDSEDSSQKTLILEEEPILEEELVLEETPKIEVNFPSVKEKLEQSQKTEILPEEIFPQVVSAEGRKEESFPQTEPFFKDFPHVSHTSEGLPQDIHSRQDDSNLTVPLIKYEELLPEEKEKSFSEGRSDVVFGKKMTDLVQDSVIQGSTLQAAAQPQAISQPSKKSFSPIVVVIALTFLFGVILVTAGVYAFREALFSTVKPTPTPFVETTPTPFVETIPSPTLTTTPQVTVEQTPEIVIQTSPTPHAEDLVEDETYLQSFSNRSVDEKRTSTLQRKNLEQVERKTIPPATKQSPKRTRNEPVQEPKKTPERRLEILQ